MNANEMEKYFEDYLDSSEYDAAEGLLLSIVRKAFLAGWKACESSKTDEPAT